jgi:hypothetical protein
MSQRYPATFVYLPVGRLGRLYFEIFHYTTAYILKNPGQDLGAHLVYLGLYRSLSIVLIDCSSEVQLTDPGTVVTP